MRIAKTGLDKWVCNTTVRLPGLLGCTVAVALFAVALASQRGLHTLLLTWLQIEGVPLDFLNDVLLQNFALEASQRIFERFTILNANFGQRPPPVTGQQGKSCCLKRILLPLSFIVEERDRPHN